MRVTSIIIIVMMLLTLSSAATKKEVQSESEEENALANTENNVQLALMKNTGNLTLNELELYMKWDLERLRILEDGKATRLHIQESAGVRKTELTNQYEVLMAQIRLQNETIKQHYELCKNDKATWSNTDKMIECMLNITTNVPDTVMSKKTVKSERRYR